MAAAGRVVAETLAHVGEQLEPGVTMRELDRIAEEHIRSHGGVPDSKGYKGFPAAICISPNSMVVHGIPGAYAVAEGDLISIDLGVTLDGYIADSAFTFPVGEISAQAQRLLDVCREALAAGIEQAQAGNRVGDISAAVQRSSRARASRSSAASSATASAAPTTRTRRSRTSARRAAGRCSRRG